MTILLIALGAWISLRILREGVERVDRAKYDRRRAPRYMAHEEKPW